MKTLSDLFKHNQDWAKSVLSDDPDFFNKLKIQKPNYLWIGCSDSRVPATQIVNLLPGDMFVHRNIANVVSAMDISCTSVIEYGINVLEIKDVIVCGHYGCGGVQASMQKGHLTGVIDHWLWNVKSLYEKYEPYLNTFSSEKEQWNKFCEINVMEQAINLSKSRTVREAWQNGKALTLHGWIYDIQDGLLQDLNATIQNEEDAKQVERILNEYL
mgnify:CR=1 FL=1